MARPGNGSPGLHGFQRLAYADFNVHYWQAVDLKWIFPGLSCHITVIVLSHTRAEMRDILDVMHEMKLLQEFV